MSEKKTISAEADAAASLCEDRVNAEFRHEFGNLEYGMEDLLSPIIQTAIDAAVAAETARADALGAALAVAVGVIRGAAALVAVPGSADERELDAKADELEPILTKHGRTD
jgi:hypothetical protein